MPDFDNRRYFLIVGALFEGVLVLVALGLGWFADIDPWTALSLTPSAVAWGLAGCVPIFAFFLVSFYYPVGPMKRIKRFLVEMLGPPLVACRWYELFALALLVGFSEEFLFRGVIQPWMERGGEVFGLVGSNVLFGLVHCITPTYAVVAGLLGVYLAMLMPWCDDGNLVVPIVSHAAYDYLAFLVVADSYRKNRPTPNTANPSGDEAFID